MECNSLALFICHDAKHLYKDYRFERLTRPTVKCCLYILDNYKSGKFYSMYEVVKTILDDKKTTVSRATIYNSLHKLRKIGCIKIYSINDLIDYLNA